MNTKLLYNYDSYNFYYLVQKYYTPKLALNVFLLCMNIEHIFSILYKIISDKTLKICIR